MDLRVIQRIVFDEYIKNGYLDMWNSAARILKDNQKSKGIVDLAEIGLFATEISETMEDIRANDIGEKEELADLIIRALNYASRKGYDMETAILAKHQINMERPKLHGKVI